MASDLITLSRALQQIPDAAECDNPTIKALISACSGVVENYCRRTFAQATYDELVSLQQPTPYIFVSNPPISRVDYVRTGLMPAIYIQNVDSTNQVQQASVDVTSTGITLTRVYNNITTTNTFTFAAYPMFGVLQTAINALGNGWQATMSSQFELWQTSDLTASNGTFSARNITCTLSVYWYYLSAFKVNEELGEIYTVGGFRPGYQNYRVKYLGGYATVPEPVQQATAELVQAAFASTKTNPLMNSETLDKYSYTKAAQASFDTLSVASKLALAQYRILRAARNR